MYHTGTSPPPRPKVTLADSLRSTLPCLILSHLGVRGAFVHECGSHQAIARRQQHPRHTGEHSTRPLKRSILRRRTRVLPRVSITRPTQSVNAPELSYGCMTAHGQSFPAPEGGSMIVVVFHLMLCCSSYVPLLVLVEYVCSRYSAIFFVVALDQVS